MLHTDLHLRLSRVYDSIQSFHVPLFQPSVIYFSSSDESHNNLALPGLRFLREQVKRDCKVLDKLLGENANPSALSTNALYLIAVWDELVHARQPLAVYRMFSLEDAQDNIKKSLQGKKAFKARVKTVKVDVVAENGARWVRVNTIKNARLMMEFREIDSYLTSDEDEGAPRPKLKQTKFDNSVLRMGRDLLKAAKVNPVSITTPLSSLFSDSNPGTPSPDNKTIPQITIRLTRLDPLEDGSDSRIEQTIQCLRDMGIDVQLGERPEPRPALILGVPTKPKLLEPTTNINLDLSALIALVSDISHSPLPRTEEEAYARFIPPQSYLDWKKERTKLLACQTTNAFQFDTEGGEDNGGTWENSGQHSRSLAAQAAQEMRKGTLEEIHERLSAVVRDPSILSSRVVFWTTSEARCRCLQIVSKIGGRIEKQRADALLGSSLCTRIPPVPRPVHVHLNDARKTSRTFEARPDIHDMAEKTPVDTYWEHSRYPARLLPLAPVHVYTSILPPMENEGQQSRTSFFDALAQTCSVILSREATPLSQISLPPDSSATTEEMPEETLPVIQTSLPKLTVHTVRSMLAGASRRCTTLTTNRSSVKAVLKEMQRLCGNGVCEPGMEGLEKVALWVLDPRSLSEGMRSE